MNKLSVRKNIKCCKFKYRGQRFLLVEDKLNFGLDCFRFIKNGVVVMCVNSDLSDREKILEIHRLIKYRGLRIINRGRNL